MNVLEKPTMEEEIASIPKKVSRERALIGVSERIIEQTDNPLIHSKIEQDVSISRARIDFLEKKLKNLELLLNEQEEGWEIVFIQDQNDHDEVWKHRSPGPDLTRTLPGSRKLGKSSQPNTPIYLQVFLPTA
jgi:hypothetical protein